MYNNQLLGAESSERTKKYYRISAKVLSAPANGHVDSPGLLHAEEAALQLILVEAGIPPSSWSWFEACRLPLASAEGLGVVAEVGLKPVFIGASGNSFISAALIC